MNNLEKKIDNSFLSKVKNKLFRFRNSISSKIALYSLAGLLGAGSYGCGSSVSDSSSKNDSEISVEETFSETGPDKIAELFDYLADTGYDSMPQEITAETDAECQKKAFYNDNDNDKFGDYKKFGLFCENELIPEGFVSENPDGFDCDDYNPKINPLALEICDSIDNNCDGNTDEGVLITSWKDKDGDGQGDKAENLQSCKIPPNYVSNPQDCNDFDVDIYLNAQELCDGKDNDCNGNTDEGFNAGGVCFSGTGVCTNSGFYQCTEDKTGTFCKAVEIQSSSEICDGLDNDCDGKIDNGLELEQQCGFNSIGECTLSSEFSYCLNGKYSEWLGCDAKLPGDEICDEKDNNCDGQTDETFNVGEICYVGVGACKNSGKFQCTLDEFDTYCNAVSSLPVAELCDGLDNNCDGQTDENMDLKDVCGASDVGECTYGTKTNPCLGGKYFGWVGCDAIFPKLEKCDDLDNDCDGIADEEMILTCKSECGEGIEVCVNGSWMSCTAPLPQLEICDGLDNDCNGQTDETFNVGEICYQGTGTCQSQGQFQCTIDGFNTFCDALPGLPESEVCDSQDNDCNGFTDENTDLLEICGISGIGECKYGTEQSTCLNGEYVLAVGCNAIFPAPEICDALDNDCNGVVDNGLSKVCSTACGNGEEVCSNGIWADCTAPKPEIEICDSLDNDCNGVIDDNFNVGEICYVGIGECKTEGMLQCKETGFETYCTALAKEPAEEVCNGLDDDCNGLIDENLTEACSTPCGQGYKICKDGVIQECDAPKPLPEVCDNLDNNCDGQVDNGICCLDQLVGHWSFDENSGNIAHDSSGKGNHGTLTNGPNWVPGIAGNALSFDGKDDYVNMSYYFNDISPEGSISLWFNLKNDWQNGDPGQFFLFSAKQGWSYNVTLDLNSTYNFTFSKSCGLGNNAKLTNSSKDSFDKDAWYNIVAVFSGADTWLYINGKLDESTYWVGESGCSSGMHTQATSAYLGAYPAGASYLNGSLDEVKVYSCTLSLEQIGEEYQKTKGK